MEIALIGSGNTASIALLQLLSGPTEHEIAIVARNPDRALAALMDAASAYPVAAQRARVGTLQDIPNAGLIIVCAGAQMQPEDTPKSLLETNATVVRDYLSGGVRSDALIVLVGTPVDDLTAVLGYADLVDRKSVVGFGGDLDTSRLRYVLASAHDVGWSDAVCVGEHGSRTVPVYLNEKDYMAVTSSVRKAIKEITQKAGPPRNLATGVWLAELASNISSESASERIVCGYHPKHELYITWPRRISAAGIAAATDLKLETRASALLNELIEQKREESAALKSLSKRLFRKS